MISILRNLDWKLNAAVFFLVAASLASLFGASQALFYKQLLWTALGLGLMAIIIQFDWRPVASHHLFIFGFYFLTLVLLAVVYFFAPAVRGARSWLSFGGFQLQPSELVKVSLILLYSFFFSRKHAAIARISNIVVPFIYLLIPAGLIALQPDFGTVLVLIFVWLGFLLISGIKWRHLFLIFLILALAGVFGWQYFLKNYQKERILGLIFPGRDPLGVNYSVIQAKIAVGSAGFLGKGFRQGTQTQLGFLTESKTDFIFAALIEEWGLVAGIFIVLLFFMIVFRITRIGLDAPNNFSRFVCLGTLILWCGQFALNVGSNLALTPVVGVTFPFLSYGGSSLLTNFILLGIIQSVFLRRSL
ncbi:MAG: FtsW/RodA/SpoVE family cell cycle protein [Patescibacteria group bacterium]